MDKKSWINRQKEVYSGKGFDEPDRSLKRAIQGDFTLRGQLKELLDIVNNPDTKNNPKILDAGCACGAISNFIMEKGCDVLGVDLPEVISKTKELYSNLNTESHDLNQTFPKGKKFDIIFASEVIEHLYNDWGFIENCYKNLKKDGTLIITAPMEPHMFGQEDSLHIRIYPLGMLDNLLSIAGFYIEKSWIEDGRKRIVAKKTLDGGNDKMTEKDLEMPHVIPWLTIGANEFLKKYFKDKEKNKIQADVLEYGMGGSTIWFSQQTKNLISIEHNRDWAEKVERYIHSKKYNPVESRVLDLPYDHIADTFGDEAFDLILVDGRNRVNCCKKSMRLLKPGGYLLLDNAERDYYIEPLYAIFNNVGWELVSETLERNTKTEGAPKPIYKTTIWRKPEEPIARLEWARFHEGA